MMLTVFEIGYDEKRSVCKLDVHLDERRYTMYVPAHVAHEANKLNVGGDPGRAFQHLLVASRVEAKRRGTARLVEGAVKVRRKFRVGDRVVSRVTGLRGVVAKVENEFVRIRPDGWESLLECHNTELEEEGKG